MRRIVWVVVILCLSMMVGGSIEPFAAAAPARQPAATTAAADVPAQAFMIPAQWTTTTGSSGISVILAVIGFAANEQVLLKFGSFDPFSGTIIDPVISASDVTDGQGQLSNVVGSTPVSLQTLPTNIPSGRYVLQAEGQSSARVVNVQMDLPLLAYNTGLTCPSSPLPVGQAFTVTGTSVANLSPLLSGASVVSAIDAVPPIETTGVVDGSGNYTLSYSIPPGTKALTYTLLAAGLVREANGYQEQLMECTITVAPSTQIQANPPAGALGSTTQVSGQYFGLQEQVQVSLQYTYTSPLANTDVPGTAQVVGTSDGSGAFSGNYTVQSTANALQTGCYNLTATGLQSHDVARLPFAVGQAAGACAPTPTPSATPTFTVTSTPTPSFTLTPTFTSTATSISTYVPPATSTSTPTATLPGIISPTPGSGLIPFPTASPTPVVPPTYTATPSAVAVVLRLHLSASVIDQGQLATVEVHTRSGMRLRFVISYQGQPTQQIGIVRANASGVASFQFSAAFGPANHAQFLPGLVTVRPTDPGLTGSAIVHFQIYPALHLTIEARITKQHLVSVLVVKTQLTRPGKVLATITLSSQPAHRFVARGSADGTHTLTFSIPLGALSGRVVVGVHVQATSREGSTEIRSMSIMAPG